MHYEWLNVLNEAETLIQRKRKYQGKGLETREYWKDKLEVARSSSPLERRNDAPRRPLTKSRSAMISVIVDSSVSESLLSQKTGEFSKSSVSPLDLGQRGSLQATAPIPVPISGPMSATTATQSRCINFEMHKLASFISSESNLTSILLDCQKRS